MQGSGKSTYARQLSKDVGAKLYEIDEFYSGHKLLNHREITELLHTNIQNDLLNGLNVVCDGTYATKFVRKNLLDSIANITCIKTIIVMGTPLDECIKRNESRNNKVPKAVLMKFAEMYQKPTLDEGWDKIITIT